VKISIVTPSYNQAEFIGHTLRSVAAQDITGLEHLVMDGGSTDGTVEVLREFRPAVRWLSERDRGQTDALNKGIRASSGEIIGWLNSDDVYYPGAVARVLEVFAQHPDVDVVYGMADHIDREGVAFEGYPTEAWNLHRLEETCFICQPALFFRRSVVERFGLPDEALHYCMDYEYWLRLGMRGARFFYLEQKLAGSRLYGENKTLGARVAVHREINDMLRRLLGRVPERWILNYAHACVESQLDRAAAPRRFLACLVWHSLVAALRWNRGISPQMRGVLVQWSRGLRPVRRGRVA
jgi:glycosyltransferase involved in cell wall biosynthesis